MRKTLLFLCWVLLFFQPLWANPVAARYPSAAYVLSDLDIDGGYLYDRDFMTYVQHHASSMEDFYRHSIQKSPDIASLLRGSLMDADMSDLLFYMALVESGLRLDARSPKRAAGLWQFMKKTAKRYNVHVSQAYDERCDPVKSTRAAIEHLRYLYHKFGKWYIAIMAYNCGEGCMAKALEKAGTDDLAILMDGKADYVPEETRHYLWKIILAAMIGESDTVDAGEESVPLLPKPACVTAPVCPEHRDVYFLSHVVKIGESLESIARQYGITAGCLLQSNHLDTQLLEVGKILLVPVDKSHFDHAKEHSYTPKEPKQI